MLYNEKNISASVYQVERDINTCDFEEFTKRHPILYENAKTNKFGKNILVSKIDCQEKKVQLYLILLDKELDERYLDYEEYRILSELTTTENFIREYRRDENIIVSELRPLKLYELITENSYFNKAHTSWGCDDTNTLFMNRVLNIDSFKYPHEVMLQVSSDFYNDKITPYNFKTKLEKIIKQINILENITEEELETYIRLNISKFDNEKGMYKIKNNDLEHFYRIMKLYDEDLYEESEVAVDQESSIKRYNFLKKKKDDILNNISGNGIAISCLKVGYKPSNRSQELAVKINNWPDGALVLRNSKYYLAFERFLYCCKLFTDYTTKIRQLILTCA